MLPPASVNSTSVADLAVPHEVSWSQAATAELVLVDNDLPIREALLLKRLAVVQVVPLFTAGAVGHRSWLP